MSLHIFVSYDYDSDKHYKRMLQAWSANSRFELEFYDQSVDVSVNSTEAAPIRRVISSRIKQSDILLCIVGMHTNRSSWVTWEIEKAIELRKKLVAVKLNPAFITPAALYGKKAKWAYSFTFAAIKRAVEEAYFGFSLSL